MSKADRAGIQVRLCEETDLSAFIKESIPSIPAVKIGDKTIAKTREQTIEEYIRDIEHHIN